MRKAVVKNSRLKAVGGIRILGDALKIIEAGANRVGASGSVVMMEEFKRYEKGGRCRFLGKDVTTTL